MDPLIWILVSTLSVSLVAWIGILGLAISESFQEKILLLIVAFAAGSLVGGAFLNLLPEAIELRGASQSTFLWCLGGFTFFLFLEQFLAWHHHHAPPSEHHEPFTYMVLLSGALHSLIEGLALGGSFLVSTEVGLVTWAATLMHEMPQALGDFGILLHGGWKRFQALFWNFISALAVVPGGLLAYVVSSSLDTTFLLPFSAGTFLYIAASDLIPEIKKRGHFGSNFLHLMAFMAGIALVPAIRALYPF